MWKGDLNVAAAAWLPLEDLLLAGDSVGVLLSSSWNVPNLNCESALLMGCVPALPCSHRLQRGDGEPPPSLLLTLLCPTSIKFL